MPDLSDRDALAYIYVATRGADRWRLTDFWLSERPTSKWYGIKVNEGAHVIELKLSDNRLDGQLTETTRLSSLCHLKVLCLDQNLLCGSISVSFRYFVELEELNLAWNLLTGEIPEAIFDLHQLRVLRLDNNQLTGPLSPHLGNLSKLKFLSLHNNRLSGEVPRVGHKLPVLGCLQLTPGNCFAGEVPGDAQDMRRRVPPEVVRAPSREVRSQSPPTRAERGGGHYYRRGGQHSHR